MRSVGTVLAVAVCRLLSGPRVTAQGPDPPQLIDQLSQNRVVRLPGAVTTVDVARVPETERLLRLAKPGRTSAQRAATAKGYVLLLRDFESAANEEQRFAVDEQLRELGWHAGIPLPEDRAERKRAAARARAGTEKEPGDRDRTRGTGQRGNEKKRTEKRRRQAKERRRRHNKRCRTG